MTCVPDFHQARSRAQVFHPLAIKHVNTGSYRCCFLWFGQRDCIEIRLFIASCVYLRVRLSTHRKPVCSSWQTKLQITAFV